MPAKITTTLPPKGTGWIAAHDHPSGSEVYLIFSEETCPEMTSREHMIAAMIHANQLIADGGIWADQARVYCLINMGTLTYDKRIPCDVCGEYVWHRSVDRMAHCYNAEHVTPGHFHEFPTDGTPKCPKCKRYNGSLRPVYVSAFDTYSTMCRECQKGDAKQSAWIYSGMAARTRRPYPPN